MKQKQQKFSKLNPAINSIFADSNYYEEKESTLPNIGNVYLQEREKKSKFGNSRHIERVFDTFRGTKDINSRKRGYRGYYNIKIKVGAVADNGGHDIDADVVTGYKRPLQIIEDKKKKEEKKSTFFKIGKIFGGTNPSPDKGNPDKTGPILPGGTGPPDKGYPFFYLFLILHLARTYLFVLRRNMYVNVTSYRREPRYLYLLNPSVAFNYYKKKEIKVNVISSKAFV